jgi:hypothetical protein
MSIDGSATRVPLRALLLVVLAVVITISAVVTVGHFVFRADWVVIWVAAQSILGAVTVVVLCYAAFFAYGQMKAVQDQSLTIKRTGEEQAQVTRDFERLKLTRELLNDPEVRPASDWMDEIIARFGDLRKAKQWIDAGMDGVEMREKAGKMLLAAAGTAAQFYALDALTKGLFVPRAALRMRIAFYWFGADFKKILPFLDTESSDGIKRLLRDSLQYLRDTQNPMLTTFPELTEEI